MKFEIKLYKPFPRVLYYTVHIDGHEICETDVFFDRFTHDTTYRRDLTEIETLMKLMGERFGAREERFRTEDDAHALPKTVNKLRLYCIRCTEGTVILGGGGRKTSQKVQDSPDCLSHFRFIKKVEKLFRERVQEGSITYNGKFLDGDLIFDLE